MGSWRAPTAAALAAVAALALAGCGSNSTNNSSGNPDTSHLGQLSRDTSNSDNATFEAKWTNTSAAGTATDITWAQQPPDSLFQVSEELILTKGPTTYFCTSKTVCVKESVGSPLTALRELYDGKTFANSISSYTTDAALRARGVSLKFHNATYAGVSSHCVDITATDGTASWCVAADSGIVTYWSADGASFALTSYTTSPPASDFELPPGAHVITL
jgi:hypothetical protein